MASEVNLDVLSRELDAKFRRFSWYISVGVGESEAGPTFYIYTKSAKARGMNEIPSRWMGYPVKVRVTGDIRPVAHSNSWA